MGNLVEIASTVDPTVDARTMQGFDPVWLCNAVLEPLEEADIEVEREEWEQPGYCLAQQAEESRP